jgi:hypothetical protein
MCDPEGWRTREAHRLLRNCVFEAAVKWRKMPEEQRRFYGTLQDFVLESIAKLREKVVADHGFIIHADAVDIGWKLHREEEYEAARVDGWEMGEVLIESDLGDLVVSFCFRTYDPPKKSGLPTTSTRGPSARSRQEISTSIDAVSLLKRSDKDDWQGPKDVG